MRIGAHVSVAGGVDRAVDRQLEVGGNCGQIFTHSPQVWAEPDIDEEEATSFREQTESELEGPWVIHSCYLINLATPKDDLQEKSVSNLQADVDAASLLDIPYVNVHLGAHTGAGEDQGLTNAAAALDELIVPDGVRIVIETDAGSGTKLGGEFEHLATVRERCGHELGVCLDTAHAFSAGYHLEDITAVEETIAEFDAVIGLERLPFIHLNDSKHDCGTHKDEHAHIGEGIIGEEGMRAVLTHPATADLPFILETPNEDDRGFAWNIQRAKELRCGQ